MLTVPAAQAQQTSATPLKCLLLCSWHVCLSFLSRVLLLPLHLCGINSSGSDEDKTACLLHGFAAPALLLLLLRLQLLLPLLLLALQQLLTR
jgi:hypothetical protein